MNKFISCPIKPCKDFQAAFLIHTLEILNFLKFYAVCINPDPTEHSWEIRSTLFLIKKSVLHATVTHEKGMRRYFSYFPVRGNKDFITGGGGGVLHS